MRASWLMPAPCAVPRTRRMVSASQVLFRSCRSTDEDTDGPALIAAMQRNSFSEKQLLAQRAALIGTAKHLRNQSRCKEASLATAELRAVVNACLSMGEA